MTKIKTADIRKSFLEYFQLNDHKLVPSAPVIPFDDPTILFANAGMNQFKDVFTGQRQVDYKRATSSQKCIRAGGKHNDLDNVGFTARHHTFFEMLGNFSFGDYFKEEAIVYAWEWVTRVVGLPKDRLYATVYTDDDDAFRLWEKIAPELKNGRVMRFGKKDNYWSMGPVGPCGPCSEIHFDRGEKFGTGPEDTINGETDRFVEIWNLVFMQFDQAPDGTVHPLPRPSVDTGAGLERLAAILQNAETNYGIDIFRSLISEISDLTGSKYERSVASHHVVADHVRALAFALADGAGISNEGRGYVLRRILRRAARHGRELGAHEPFIYRLVPVLVNEMSDVYPELRDKQSHIEAVIKSEEEKFGQTLETGLELFGKIAEQARKTGSGMIDGSEIFRLYDTYGFPYDLTEVLASEHGLKLDKAGFNESMKEQQERSRSGTGFDAASDAILEKMIAGLEKAGLPPEPTHFVRRDEAAGLSVDTRSLGSVEYFRSEEESEVVVVLEETPFYVEAGGQIDDSGEIRAGSSRMIVSKLVNHQDKILHVGRVVNGRSADFRSGEKVTASVNVERRWDIMRNHTATHLAHAALRKVLGDHVRQSGSYVGPDRLRFDFSHHQPMTSDEIAEVERIVNRQILAGAVVVTEEMDIDKARAAGAMALFGEKYADRVRVVSVDGFSCELCGGTHVDNVSQIGPFFIIQETGIASGVRRLEGITGSEAVKYMLDGKRFRQEVSAVVGRPEAEALDGVRQLKESNAVLQKDLKKARAEMFSSGGSSAGQEVTIGRFKLICRDFGEAADKDVVGVWADEMTRPNSPVIALGLFDAGGKRQLAIKASSSAVKENDFHAGDFARAVLPKLGGRGGGKPNFSQGSVANGTGWEQLEPVIRSYLAGDDS